MHSVRHSSEMAYPHGDSLSMGGNLRQFNLDATEEEHEASHVANMAAYEATGTSLVSHIEHRKRDVAGKIFCFFFFLFFFFFFCNIFF